MLGGLSIIDKTFDEAPLSSEDDSDREMLLIRLVSAKLTRRRMIGVEFLEIYDRQWRPKISPKVRRVFRQSTCCPILDVKKSRKIFTRIPDSSYFMKQTYYIDYFMNRFCVNSKATKFDIFFYIYV